MKRASKEEVISRIGNKDKLIEIAFDLTNNWLMLITDSRYFLYDSQYIAYVNQVHSVDDDLAVSKTIKELFPSAERYFAYCLDFQNKDEDEEYGDTGFKIIRKTKAECYREYQCSFIVSINRKDIRNVKEGQKIKIGKREFEIVFLK